MELMKMPHDAGLQSGFITWRKGTIMSQQLKDKIAIVTGGGTGIGKAIAVRYAKEGAQVVITGRREAKLQEVAAEQEGISYVAADLTKTEDVTKVVDFVKEKFGRLDVLVNNAGWCPVQSIKDLTLNDYDVAFSLDVRAVVDITIQALPLLLESKGTIINMSTNGVQHRALNLSMYIGAKSAVENFTRCWALDLVDDGVRVNAIAPGAIRTDIWNVTNLPEKEAREHEARTTANIPMKRFGTPDEIANAALFLASDESSYIDGAVIGVDGGISAL